jgi:hypothetical protein
MLRLRSTDRSKDEKMVKGDRWICSKVTHYYSPLHLGLDSIEALNNGIKVQIG